MSNRKYPRIGDVVNVPRGKQPTCRGLQCHFKTATKIVTIQTSWFRGEDEVTKLCGDCLAALRKELSE